MIPPTSTEDMLQKIKGQPLASLGERYSTNVMLRPSPIQDQVGGHRNGTCRELISVLEDGLLQSSSSRDLGT